MGRPERPLDPEAGPVAEFAHALRELRKQAGNPSYRTIAADAHYSHTVISDAARGERLPTLAVTLAFVRVCGGDTAAWEARWHLTQQRASGSDPSDATQEAAEQPAADRPTANRPGEEPEPPSRGRGVRFPAWLVIGVSAVLLVTGSVWAGWQLHPSSQPAPKVRIEDGTNPKLAGCATDSRPIDTAPVLLRKPAHVHEHYLPTGTQVGMITLYYSERCAGAWPRFSPTPGLDPDHPDGNNAAAILVEAERAIDGTGTVWKMGHLDSAYADLLLTGHGCVVARATVQMAGQDSYGTGETHCLPRV